MQKKSEDDGRTRDPLWRITPQRAARSGGSGQLSIAEANRRDRPATEDAGATRDPSWRITPQQAAKSGGSGQLSTAEANRRDGEDKSPRRLGAKGRSSGASSARKKAIADYKG